MGADFLLIALPNFKRTTARKKELLKLIDAKLYFEDDDEDDTKTLVVDMPRDTAMSVIDTFFEKYFHQNRDVTEMSFDNKSYLFSGGMSWGDSPSDSFEVMNEIINITEYLEDDLFDRWFTEDLTSKKNTKKIK